MAEGQIDEGRYLVLSHMEGTPLRERRADMSIETGRKLMHSLGELIGRLHLNVGYEQVGLLNGRSYRPSDWGRFMGIVLQGHLEAPYIDDVFTRDEQGRIRSYATTMAGHEFDFPVTLATHDWHDGQILVSDAGEITGMVPAVHNHRGPGQLAQVTLIETFYGAPWNGETDPAGLESAFNDGYSSSTGTNFPNDPEVEKLLWLNQFLYAGPSKRGKRSSLDGERIREGFAEMYAHKTLQLVDDGLVNHSKFFELRRDEGRGEDIGYVLQQHQHIVEERKALFDSK